MDSKASAKAKEKAERDPEADAFSRERKADLISPTATPMPGKQKDNGKMIGKMLPGMTGPGTRRVLCSQGQRKERKEGQRKRQVWQA